MKLTLAGIAIVVVAAGCTAWWLTRSHQSEVLLSSGVVVTPEWQRITSPQMFMTKAPWSDVLIEMPNLEVPRARGPLLLNDGTSLRVDGYLITEDAKEVTLDQVETVGFGTKTVLQLSTAALHWKQRDYRFRALALRSNKAVQTGKVRWMSYDPRETKDGMVFPRALN